MIIKSIHKDGSTGIMEVYSVLHDISNPKILEITKLNGKTLEVNDSQWLVYSGSSVIFTIDLATGKPLPNFGV